MSTTGISMITALEIFTHPRDLEISIIQEKNGGKYAIAYSRGPGHNFKLLLSTQPFAEKIDDAVEIVRETLELIQQVVTKEFENRKSIVSQYLNPYGQAIDQSKVLNSDLIRRITEELRQHQVASTYKMP